MVLFLVGGYLAIENMSDLSNQRRHLQNWETAQNVHQLNLSHIWQGDSDEGESQMDQLEKLRLALTENNSGFIMNSDRIYAHDHHSEWMPRGEDAPLFEVDPNGNRIDITIGYLNLNPIQAANDFPIEEQIVWDQHVLNLLVPISLMADEDLIQELYLQEFYFGGYSWREEKAENSVSMYTIDDLTINIIYVENEQYYFTFDARLRPEEGSRIQDPIAVIITDNIDLHFTRSLMSTSFYFISESIDPFSDIAEAVDTYDLNYSIRFVQSVFAENADRIRLLEQDILNGFLALSALITTNLIVNYNLISNYFWRNKHTLFTKSLFGFSPLRRHKWFIISFLAYVIPIIMITTFFFGWTVFVIASLFLVIDIVLATMFERHLMKKSFAEVIKGER